MSSVSYPARVRAALDPDVGRWKWLLKWLLLLPHYVVLLGLWMAFVTLSIGAFLAILFTGRYPRAIFDFNVGVLRWTWRVSYYAYGALGTDRYPPFTLADRPDYPAHFEVDYPEHLSRGLVLVKWWLLAIPHLLVVGILVGGVGYTVSADGGRFVATGLIGLLTLVAGLTLLFTGRYPPALFDLLLGLNRWVLRVAAYVALMTDTYPPFRLDQGEGEDPVPVPPVAAAPVEQAHGTGWTGGRVATAVVSGVLLPLWLGLVGAGIVLAVADVRLRDDLGYLMSPHESLVSGSYAITSKDLEVRIDEPAQGLAEALIGGVRVSVSSQDTPVFIGIAPAAEVEAYLGAVRHATVVDYTDRPVYDVRGRAAPAGLPTGEDFWVAESHGVGEQGIVWHPRTGEWRLVLMNADGRPGVAVQVAVGATVPGLDGVVVALLSAGGTGLVLTVLVLGLTVRAAARR